MQNDLNLQINDFDGPLDLLLELVKDKQMDIFSIDLTEVASKYLKLIAVLKDKNIDLASEYLVMAATLLQIKAKLLLKDPNNDETPEEARNLLAQLSEHQQYKNIAKTLREKELERKKYYIKAESDYSGFQYKADPARLDGKSDGVKLITALRKMFERVHAQQYRSATIETFNLSPAERRIELIQLFKEKGKIEFEDIFAVPTMNHFVITMLTLLDMARKQEVKLYQEDQFGDIRIEKGIINE